jgi:predicted nuclease of predicted toxin-antitoxin system
MKILLDMNLSPRWAGMLAQRGFPAIHWHDVGDPAAADRAIMDWARENDYVIFTHDLDFGALLAATGNQGPSVIQVRTQDLFPEALIDIVISALNQFRDEFDEGALVTIDPDRRRVRLLPILR